MRVGATKNVESNEFPSYLNRRSNIMEKSPFQSSPIDMPSTQIRSSQSSIKNQQSLVARDLIPSQLSPIQLSRLTLTQRSQNQLKRNSHQNIFSDKHHKVPCIEHMNPIYKHNYLLGEQKNKTNNNISKVKLYDCALNLAKEVEQQRYNKIERNLYDISFQEALKEGFNKKEGTFTKHIEEIKPIINMLENKKEIVSAHYENNNSFIKSINGSQNQNNPRIFSRISESKGSQSQSSSKVLTRGASQLSKGKMRYMSSQNENHENEYSLANNTNLNNEHKNKYILSRDLISSNSVNLQEEQSMRQSGINFYLTKKSQSQSHVEQKQQNEEDENKQSIDYSISKEIIQQSLNKNILKSFHSNSTRQMNGLPARDHSSNQMSRPYSYKLVDASFNSIQTQNKQNIPANNGIFIMQDLNDEIFKLQKEVEASKHHHPWMKHQLKKNNNLNDAKNKEDKMIEYDKLHQKNNIILSNYYDKQPVSLTTPHHYFGIVKSEQQSSLPEAMNRNSLTSSLLAQNAQQILSSTNNANSSATLESKAYHTKSKIQQNSPIEQQQQQQLDDGKIQDNQIQSKQEDSEEQFQYSDPQNSRLFPSKQYNFNFHPTYKFIAQSEPLKEEESDGDSEYQQ